MGDLFFELMVDEMRSNITFTLTFIKQNSKVLLGFKTRGLGVGLWNGFGGKVEIHESIYECAKRELKEESNVEVNCLKYLGCVTYEEDNAVAKSLVHVFTASEFYGNVAPSEEMNPIQWYNFSDIPYARMWPDAKLWYPYMLEDKLFSACFKYDAKGNIKENLSRIYRVE